MLQLKGSLIMEELFPGFTHRLHEEGAIQCPAVKGFTIIFPDVGQLPQLEGVAPELVVQLATRHLIEGTMRGFINQNPAVEYLLGSQATGLLVEDGRVHGVHISDGSTLEADFVVDCMGRTSRIADWLATLGYNKPDTSTLSADVCYVSR